MELEKSKETYEEPAHMNDIRAVVSEVSKIIDEHPVLRDMNFALFYQHGRLGYMDLNAFAESTKLRLEEDGEEKTLTEVQKDIDKDKE